MTRRFPPLNAVRAFEAAARHLNFARAAEELGVTQSAVSKQIASLESHIGARLFEREAGGVSLTLEGRELVQAISPAFDALAESFQRFSRKAPRSNRFRLATVASFAAAFLVPRLAAFEKDMPGLELEILTSDRMVDLAREEIDISVRYGAGAWDGLVAAPLDDGALAPVCAPALFESANGDAERLLAGHRRVQVFLKNEWRAWENATGVRPPDAPPMVMEHFMVAAQAALAGYGLALLPRLLIQDRIDRGDVVQFGPLVPWDQSFFVAHRPHADQKTGVREVLAWLKAQSAA